MTEPATTSSKAVRGPTIAAFIIAKLLQFAASRGLDPDALQSAAGLSDALSSDPEGRVAMSAHYRLWSQIMSLLDDPAAPLQLSLMFRVEDLRVLGFALLTSRDGREAIDRTMRYHALLTDSGTWNAREEGDAVALQWNRWDPLSLPVRVSNEAALAVFLSGLRQLSDRPLIPLEIRFRHRAPSTLAAHRDFFRCPLRFDAQDYAVVVARESLQTLAPAAANPAMARYFDEQAQGLLGQLAGHKTITTEVEEAIAGALASGEPAMDDIAKRLGMAARTLRRRLQDDGTTFRETLDRARRRRAKELVADPRYALSEVAFLLGFSQLSAFSRAFKRWFGVRPRAYRQGNR